MKIGIATFHRASNYGAVLQAFALQTFLRSKGHDPFFMAHQFGMPPPGYKKYLGKTPSGTLARWATIRRSIVFLQFARTYLRCSSNSVFDSHDTIKHPPEAEAYVCGSDQVWNPSYLQRPIDERLFFLDFGPDKIRRVAYAASLGVESIPSEWCSRFVNHLRRFDYIGVREKEAARMLAELSGKSVEWVPDPTLLLDASAYREVLGISSRARSEIFSYTLDKTVSPLVNKTRNCVKSSLNLPLVETYVRNSLCVLMHGVPSPSQWLASLATSRFVLTNSFHGTIFAILFHRPFIVLPVEGRMSGMNTRITSLLERLGLTERFVSKFNANMIDHFCHEPIDWTSVDERKRVFATTGAAFLGKALET